MSAPWLFVILNAVRPDTAITTPLGFIHWKRQACIKVKGFSTVEPFCVGIWLILGEQLQNSLKKNKTVARAAYVVLGISMIASLLLA